MHDLRCHDCDPSSLRMAQTSNGCSLVVGLLTTALSTRTAVVSCLVAQSLKCFGKAFLRKLMACRPLRGHQLGVGSVGCCVLWWCRGVGCVDCCVMLRWCLGGSSVGSCVLWWCRGVGSVGSRLLARSALPLTQYGTKTDGASHNQKN